MSEHVSAFVCCVVLALGLAFGGFYIGAGLTAIGAGLERQQLETMITSMQIQQGIIPLVPRPNAKEI